MSCRIISGIEELLKMQSIQNNKDMVEIMEECIDRRQASLVNLKRAQFKNFADGESVVDAVKAGVKDHPGDLERGASAIGLSRRAYSFIHKMLVLQEQHIPQSHKETLRQALALVDEDKNISRARQLAGDVVDALWQKRKTPTKTKMQNKRLDQTLIHIRESCECTRDMAIPRDLTPDAAREAVATLAASTILIGQLIRRLLGEGED